MKKSRPRHESRRPAQGSGSAAIESSPRKTRAPMALAVVAAAALAAVFAATDRGHSPDDPLEECAAYAATLRRCFGDEAPIVAAPPPRTAPERAAARKRCDADRARIERACH